MTEFEINSCPVCREQGTFETCHTSELHLVRSEYFRVVVEYVRCSGCGTELERAQESSLQAQANALYRRAYRWLTPEEIANWRTGLPLASDELDRELGWRVGTTARYEKGTLQSPEHESALRAAMKSLRTRTRRRVRAGNAVLS
jgi:hypothetical protein